MRRTCKVTLTDLHGVSALAAFRQEGWAAEALVPGAVLRIEVQLPPVIHEVPIKALERWGQAPSSSPKEYAAKRLLR